MKKTLLAFSLLAFGCAKSPDNRVGVEFWTIQLKPTFTAYVEGLIASYERAHPGVRVDWVDVPFSGVKERLLTAYLAGSPPDVVNLNVDVAMSMAALGALVDVEKALPEAVRREFIPGVWDSTRIGGSVYALPWYLATNVAMYNKDILAKARVPVPRSFPELEAAAKAVRERTGKFALCPKIGKDTDLLKLFAMEGAPVLVDGRIRITDRTALETLEFWKRLFKRGDIPRAAVTDDHRTALDMYIREELAIFLSGPQFLKTIRENNPGLYAKTDVAPPILGRAGVSDVDVMDIAVTNASKHQAEALDFAAFVTNGPNQLAFCKLVPILPSVKSALNDPFFSRAGPTLENKARSLAAKTLLGSRPLVAGLRNASSVQAIVQQATEEVFFGKKSVADGLKEAEAAINRLNQN